MMKYYRRREQAAKDLILELADLMDFTPEEKKELKDELGIVAHSLYCDMKTVKGFSSHAKK